MNQISRFKGSAYQINWYPELLIRWRPYLKSVKRKSVVNNGPAVVGFVSQMRKNCDHESRTCRVAPVLLLFPVLLGNSGRSFSYMTPSLLDAWCKSSSLQKFEALNQHSRTVQAEKFYPQSQAPSSDIYMRFQNVLVSKKLVSFRMPLRMICHSSLAICVSISHNQVQTSQPVNTHGAFIASNTVYEREDKI